VSAYVLHQKLFRSSIIEAFERSKKKWLAEKNKEKNKEFGAIIEEIIAAPKSNNFENTIRS
jgi:hypothetical protein